MNLLKSNQKYLVYIFTAVVTAALIWFCLQILSSGFELNDIVSTFGPIDYLGFYQSVLLLVLLLFSFPFLRSAKASFNTSQNFFEKVLASFSLVMLFIGACISLTMMWWVGNTVLFSLAFALPPIFILAFIFLVFVVLVLLIKKYLI
ncbi:hypothetical protein EBR66_04240 [bacterium]|nr:hypothetical protein [bacterium]